ncbi:MAG: EAL domain-containing protein [Psychrobium sp.]
MLVDTDERLRLEEVLKYNLSLDTPEESFTELAEIAKFSLGVPISGISIVDDHHIWLKARVGVDVSCLNREGAFCSYAVGSNHDTYVVEDTLKDELFVNNPLVVEHGIRFYAAAVLRNKQGFNIGTLWIMDTSPHTLAPKELTILNSLASQAIRLLDYRYTNLVTNLPNRATFITQLQTFINEYVEDSTNSNAVDALVGVICIRNMDVIESIVASQSNSGIQISIAKRIASSFELQHILAHLDNDLYAFVISGGTDEEYQSEIDRLTEVLSKPIELDNYQAPLSVSIGLVECPAHGINASSLLSQAITVAKGSREHKQGVRTKRCSRISNSEYIKELHEDLNRFTNGSAVTPFYQPQVDVETNSIIGFEALARWKNCRLGIIPPINFIPIAEDSGLVISLDLFILKTVCSDLTMWQNLGLDLVVVSVNFSRTTLLSKDLIVVVEDLISHYDSIRNIIKIEITESTMLDESDPAGERINELRSLGLHVSIDDFGTGFSNLTTLRLLKFDQLKVDRQFVHNIAQSNQLAELFSFIQNVASLFEVNLMCEGMENEEDIDVLIAKGCRYMQGWYFSKAMPAYKVAKLLKNLPRLSSKTSASDYKLLAKNIRKACEDNSL